MKKNSSSKPEDSLAAPTLKKDFLIVGLGASAGGIKALKDFFANVPRNSGNAYVVILHLSPEHESSLAEVLQTTASIPVKQVKEKQVEVKPNNIYVISPNKSLTINGGRLSTSDITSHEERRAPVDIFFRTLAESHHSYAVSVILSGTGANGSMGVKRIKEKGGVIIVQDPDEAEYNDMPRNTIATGLVDYVLSVADIPAQINAYKNQLGNVRIPLETEATPDEADEKALREIFTQLRLRTGHDFSNYKRATVLRRIERRMNVNGVTDLPAYSDFMRARDEETHALLKDLLISVTNFFRDAASFETLGRDVIPKILENKNNEDAVRIWVPGCATGEEAYSIAILFAEHNSNGFPAPNIQIFATDIDEKAIATARSGIYTNSDVADVSPERLRLFFQKDGEHFRVRREIREMMLFAAHNVTKDPPFSHLDLISCRNLLIYLNRVAQKRVMETAHFALKPGGYLYLGSSESIDGAGDLFVPVNKENRIFQSRPVAARLSLPAPNLSLSIEHKKIRGTSDQHRVAEIRALERLSYTALHQQLLEQYAPPSVVVNDEFDIVHISENAGRYMQFSGGEPSTNLLHAARPELRLELRTALYRATKNRTDVTVENVDVAVDSRIESIDIHIRPTFREDDVKRGYILVIFEQSGARNAQSVESVRIASDEPVARQLEEELIRTKSQLRATIEQYEVQTEELKASNEELQAINEELRSAAEELETSKEELQSVNEELRTVNDELNIKIEELSQSHNDLQNLMNSTDVGTIFLDRMLNVKMFTDSVRRIINFLPNDLGRPLTDITGRFRYAGLLEDVGEVFKTLQTIQREIETDENEWYLMRIFPYRTSEDRISGAVVTFLNITDRKVAEEILRRGNEKLRLLIESSTDYAIFTLDSDGNVDSWNVGAERIFGYAEEDIIGRSGDILFTAEDRANRVPEKEMEGALATGRAEDERWHVRRDGSHFYASGVMQPLRETGGGFVKICRDQTSKIKSETALRDSEMLKQLVTTQEDERRRIARDIHDHLGQQLTALRLKLESVKKICRDEDICDGIEEAQATAEELDREIDFLAWELRPASLDDLGLRVTLANFIAEWSSYSGVKAEFHSTGFGKARLPFETETNLYRIAQEALNNVAKHARAQSVSVLLEKRGGKITLIIEDDGVGFDPGDKKNRTKGIGLVGMIERAKICGGSLEIESNKGKGTTVFAKVPVKK